MRGQHEVEAPAAKGRLGLLKDILPLGVVEASHFVGSIALDTPDEGRVMVGGRDLALRPGNVLEAPVLLGVESAASDGVQLRLTVKTTPGTQFELQRALLQAVKRAFDEAGIPRPPPQPQWTRQPPP